METVGSTLEESDDVEFDIENSSDEFRGGGDEFDNDDGVEFDDDNSECRRILVGERDNGDRGDVRAVNDEQILFDSRKLVVLDKRIVRAMVALYSRSTLPIFRDDEKRLFVVRRDMNLFSVGRTTSRYERAESATSAIDGSNVLMRLISSVMKDVQQRCLNAKHSASKRPRLSIDEPQRNDESSTNVDLYIGLNKSCAQRRVFEVCCALTNDSSGTADIELLREDAELSRELGEFENLRLLYLVTTRKRFAITLRRLSSLPRLVFCSAKNLVYAKEKNGDGLELYLCNFLLYHIFHECDRSFDARRLGESGGRMRTLFLLGLVNAELLRVDKRGNANLALNMQSLGKAYDDPGFHLFSENSIQHVRKLFVRGGKDYDARCGGDDDENATRTLRTSGILVNRYLGTVSRIGVNSRQLTRFLY